MIVRRITVALLVVLTVVRVQAQKTKLEEGAFKAIRKEKALLLEFDYDGMKVKKQAEKEYVDERKAKLNEKESGLGDKWAIAWFDDRSSKFEPAFERGFNSNTNDLFTADRNNNSARFKLVVKTVMTDPGYIQTVTKQVGFIDTYITLFDTQKEGKVIAKIHIWDVTSDTYGKTDHDTSTRLSEAYAKLGKELAEYIVKKGLK